MCGRIACLLDPKTICAACSQQPQWRDAPTGQYYPSANMMPSRYCPVMYRAEDGELVVQPMLWGLIPPWHKGTPTSHHLSTNNARIETVESSKLYARFTKTHRCILLAQGFYEWQTVGRGKGPKEPYFIFQGIEKEVQPATEDAKIKKKGGKKSVVKQEKDVKPKVQEPVKTEAEGNVKVENIRLAWGDENNIIDGKWTGPALIKMASLYSVWKDEEGNDVYSFSVITMASNNTLSWLHDRMPAILETEEQCEAWLNGDDLKTVLKPATQLKYYAVDQKVNNAKCHDEDCMDPKADVKPKKEATLMSNWLKRPDKDETTVKAEQKSPKKSKK